MTIDTVIIIRYNIVSRKDLKISNLFFGGFYGRYVISTRKTAAYKRKTTSNQKNPKQSYGIHDDFYSIISGMYA